MNTYVDNLTLIRYHWDFPGPNDPYYLFNSSENLTRIETYYRSNYTPHLFIDGNVDATYDTPTWDGLIEIETYDYSPLKMDMWGTFDSTARAGTFHVRIVVEDIPGLSNLRLRVALTESQINWRAPNSGIWHHQTFRDMIPSTYGKAVTLVVGDTLDWDTTFTTPSPIVPRNCHLVAFVQSEANRHILQGARVAVADLTPTGVNEEFQTPQTFALEQNYPNPFNAQTKIDFSTEGGVVRLEVYDITGALVKTLINASLQSGYHSIVWDGRDGRGESVSSGVYFYRLKDASGTLVKHMTLLK